MRCFAMAFFLYLREMTVPSFHADCTSRGYFERVYRQRCQCCGVFMRRMRVKWFGEDRPNVEFEFIRVIELIGLYECC